MQSQAISLKHYNPCDFKAKLDQIFFLRRSGNNHYKLTHATREYQGSNPGDDA